MHPISINIPTFDRKNWRSCEQTEKHSYFSKTRTCKNTGSKQLRSSKKICPRISQIPYTETSSVFVSNVSKDWRSKYFGLKRLFTVLPWIWISTIFWLEFWTKILRESVMYWFRRRISDLCFKKNNSVVLCVFQILLSDNQTDFTNILAIGWLNSMMTRVWYLFDIVYVFTTLVWTIQDNR